LLICGVPERRPRVPREPDRIDALRERRKARLLATPGRTDDANLSLGPAT
jgi:hypothetical protein